MEKTPLQEVSENFFKLPSDKFIEWFGRNRERLTTAEHEMVVYGWEAGKVDGKNISYNGHSLHESGKQYYRTKYGER